MEYDSDDRDAMWDYSALQLYREEAEPTYANGEPKFNHTVNLNTQGLVAEVYSKVIGYAYTRYLTYDSQRRLVSEEIYEQVLNNDTGSPITNPALLETYTYTWDEESNLTLIKRQAAGSDHYTLIKFSDFSEKIENTLKPVNFGFDFYGPYGYPANEVSGGGNGGYYIRESYAGQYLPAERKESYFFTANDQPYNATVYNYVYTYEQDSDGRVTEIRQEDANGEFWYTMRVSY